MAGVVVHRRDEVYGDPGVHALSVAYFENLKNAPMAHRVCMDMLTARAPLDDRAKFVCLSLIADYIRKTYLAEPNPAARQEVRNFLTRYIAVQLAPRKIVRMPDSHVRSLAAEIFARVGLAEYPAHWPDFFAQLVGVARTGVKGVDHLLRTMSVVARLITGRPTTEVCFERYLGFVRHFQDTDFEDVLDVWCDVIEEGVESVVKRECMAVMCEYMTLVEPERFSKHRLVIQLMSELEDGDMQTHALSCFHELLKAMTMTVKEHRDFVGRLFQHLASRRLATAAVVSSSGIADVFALRMGATLNTVGIHLLELASRLMRGGVNDADDAKEKYYSNLEAFFPYAVGYLDSKDIRLSTSVIPFFVGYTRFLKKRQKLSHQEYNHFIQVLGIVLTRMKLKPTYRFAEDDEDAKKESTFDGYRQTLSGLFEDIAKVKRKVVFKGVYQVILKHLSRKDWTVESFNVAEYPVFLVNLLGATYHEDEVTDRTARPTRTLMRTLLDSHVVSHPHPAVTSQYFRAVAERVGFFAGEATRYVSTALADFNARGLENASARVRNACARHFLAFVRGMAHRLDDSSFVDVIKTVQRLVITPDTFGEGSREGRLSRASQLCLCEVAGVAVCHGKFHKQNKRHFLAEVLVPAMHMYHEACQQWATGRDHDHCAERICHAFGVVASIARPFDAASAAFSGCDDVFVDTVTIVDHCAMTQLVRADVHTAMTQLIRQMAITLDERFACFVPKMMQGMMYCKIEANVLAVVEVFVALVRRYGRGMYAYFKYEFLRVCFHVYDAYGVSALQNLAQQKEKKKASRLAERQELFLSFLAALDETAMFVDIFSTLDEKTTGKLVGMISSSTLEGRGGGVTRVRGLALLGRIVDKWAVTSAPQPKEAHTHTKHFVRAVLNRAFETCFAAMRDAIAQLDNRFQNYLDVFARCSAMIGRMYRRRGDEMLAWLVRDYLPRLRVAPHLTDELIEVLLGDPMMTLEDYLKSFFFEADDIHIPPLNPFGPVASAGHLIPFIK